MANTTSSVWAPLSRKRVHDRRLFDDYENKILASKHHNWCLGLPFELQNLDILAANQDIPTFIAIGGGKGGVGKSVISANLGASLGNLGYKTLIIDLDFGGSNLHTYFGLPPLQFTLADFLLGHEDSLQKLITPSTIERVDIIGGGKDEAWSETSEYGYHSFSSLWKSLIYAKQNYQYDFVLFDLGAGTHRHTIDFFSAAHLGVVAVLPEPTSIENAYAFLKACLYRSIDNLSVALDQKHAMKDLKDRLFLDRPEFKSKSFVQKMHILATYHPQLLQPAIEMIKGRSLGVVINQIRCHRDIEIGKSMATICNSYFGFQASLLGFLNHDESASKAIRNRRLLIQDFPHCVLSKRILEVAHKTIHTLGY